MELCLASYLADLGPKILIYTEDLDDYGIQKSNVGKAMFES
jgi:hypothetical protein